MVTRLGAVPAVLCIVAAALLGGWGWGAHQDSRDQAREEAARRAAAEEEIERMPPGMDPNADPTEMICAVLIDAAMLQAPIDRDAMFDEPGEGPIPSVASSPTDTAWALVGILHEDLLEGTDLDEPELRDAVVGLGNAISVALAHTGEPLADPEVIAAAAHLRETLVGWCL